MMKRSVLSNDMHFVEAPDTPEGRKWLEEFRKNHTEFKRRRIKSVLQGHPDQIKMYKVYEFNSPQSLASLVWYDPKNKN